jgi:curved DNA-binding protein
MDYYSTLGLNKGATNEEIKKAYRSMAMKHHPDRGGDEQRFKEIEEAYRTLSDPQKKQMFDMGVDPNSQQSNTNGWNSRGFEFHFGSGNIDDIFNQFGFGFAQRPQRKNRSININIDISLEDVLTGRDINAELNIDNTKPKIINITIPPGLESGQQIRYQGMGDDSIPGIPPGDLLVNINVRPHPIFKRDRTNLFIEKYISFIDAVQGTNLKIKTLDNKTLDITVPKGTQPDSVLSCRGEGLPDGRTKQRGNLFVKIKLTIPTDLDQEKIDRIKAILSS